MRVWRGKDGLQKYIRRESGLGKHSDFEGEGEGGLVDGCVILAKYGKSGNRSRGPEVVCAVWRMCKKCICPVSGRKQMGQKLCNPHGDVVEAMGLVVWPAADEKQEKVNEEREMGTAGKY